jgi:ferredoxin
MLHRVHFRRENVTVLVPDEANLRKACLDHDVDPYPLLGGLLSCHGKGFCGTCLVEVDDPESLTPPSKREARYLKRLKSSANNLRLSCQAVVKGPLNVTTDPDKKPSWKTHTYYSGRIERSWEKAS